MYKGENLNSNNNGEQERTAEEREALKSRGRQAAKAYLLSLSNEELEEFKKLKSDEQRKIFDDVANQYEAALEEQNLSAEANGEKISEEQARETYEKAKGNRIVKALVASAMLVIVTTGVVTNFMNKVNTTPPPQDNIVVEQSVDYSDKEQNVESISDKSTYHGHFANEDGTDYNPDKALKFNFGEALESDVSEEEMKSDLGGRMVQTGQLAASYFYMQEKTSNPNFGVDGATFDSPNALQEAMENNPELHQAVYDYVMQSIANGQMSESVISGVVHNFFMDSNFETGDVDTSKVEVVAGTTTEDNSKVYVLESEWVDDQGNIHKDTFTFKVICGGQPVDLMEFTSSVRQVEIPEPDTGTEGTGTEGTGTEGTGTEGTGTEGTGTEGTGTEGTGTEGFEKSYDNMERIDNKINQEIKTDVNTKELKIEKVPTVTEDTKTEKPASNDYQGTEAKIQKNKASTNAEIITNNISPENDYSKNLGSKNPVQQNIVKEDVKAQQEADKNEIKIPPQTQQEVKDILSELGIN